MKQIQHSVKIRVTYTKNQNRLLDSLSFQKTIAVEENRSDFTA